MDMNVDVWRGLPKDGPDKGREDGGVLVHVVVVVVVVVLVLVLLF